MIEYEYIDWEEIPERDIKYEEWYGGKPLTPEVEAGITEAWEKL